MRDLDAERHLRWMHACTWVTILGTVLGMFTFLMYWMLGLSVWAWWLAWVPFVTALVARQVGEHHHRKFQELLRQSYMDPWWLGIDHPIDDWRDR